MLNLNAKDKFFSKVGQKLRSQGQNFWYYEKGLATRNTHM